MDELEKALLRHEQRKGHYESEKDDKKISRMFTKVLLSVILVLSCTIYMKLSEEILGIMIRLEIFCLPSRNQKRKWLQIPMFPLKKNI